MCHIHWRAEQRDLVSLLAMTRNIPSPVLFHLPGLFKSNCLPGNNSAAYWDSAHLYLELLPKKVSSFGLGLSDDLTTILRLLDCALTMLCLLLWIADPTSKRLGSVCNVCAIESCPLLLLLLLLINCTRKVELCN